MIGDEDKKFLKETIDNAIKERLNAHEKKTESQKKIEQLKQDKKEKEAKLELLKELQERDKKGENTLAQKMEMYKLSVDKALPQAAKTGMKVSGNLAKSGVSQLGNAASTITGNLAQLNPITAMLWKNKDLIKDLTMGTLKTTAGIAGGVISGGAGLIKAAKDKFKKEDKKENKKLKIQSSPEGERVNVAQEESSTEFVIESKSLMTQQIEDIHKAIIKDLNPKLEKQGKTSTNILSKGLGGLGKNMGEIGKMIKLMNAKNMLILGGVILAGVLLKKAFDWLKNRFDEAGGNGSTPPSGQNDVNALDNLTKTQDAMVQDNKTVSEIIKQNKGGEDSFKVERQGEISVSNASEWIKKGIITEADADELYTDNKSGNNFGQTLSISKNTKPVALFFPFKIKIKSVSGSTNKNTNFISMEIERLSIGKNKTIKITKILQQLWATGEPVPENTAFAIADKNFGIIGDFKDFCNDEDEKAVKNWQENNELAASNYEKNRTEDVKQKHFEKTKKEAEQTYNDRYTHNDNFIDNKIEKTTKEKLLGKPTFNKETLTGKKEIAPSLNDPIGEAESSKNVQKVDEQLNKKEEVKPQETETKTEKTEQKPTHLSFNTNNYTPNSYPTMMNANELNVALFSDIAHA